MTKKQLVIVFFLCVCSWASRAEEVLPEVGVTPPPPPSEIVESGSQSANQEATLAIKKDAPLTDNIKQNKTDDEGDTAVSLPAISGALADKVAAIEKKAKNIEKSAGETLSDMMNIRREESSSSPSDKVNKQITVKRSNAAVFDISGAMLRMNPAQIDAALTRRGYKKTVQKLDIPNFIRWRNEEKCRAQGVVGYERVENCVAQMAKKDNHQFIERVFYSKYDTQEDMEIRFTSNFTQNKSYYVAYKSNVLRNIRGNSQKEFYLRNIKIYDFWKKVNQKYGAPDNRDSVIWGLGGNKPYLQAGTGLLRLEDPVLRDLDYARMSREDKRFMNTGLYNF